MHGFQKGMQPVHQELAAQHGANAADHQLRIRPWGRDRRLALEIRTGGDDGKRLAGQLGRQLMLKMIHGRLGERHHRGRLGMAAPLQPDDAAMQPGVATQLARADQLLRPESTHVEQKGHARETVQELRQPGGEMGTGMQQLGA